LKPNPKDLEAKHTNEKNSDEKLQILIKRNLIYDNKTRVFRSALRTCDNQDLGR
jgi:hypothetical protein